MVSTLSRTCWAATWADEPDVTAWRDADGLSLTLGGDASIALAPGPMAQGARLRRPLAIEVRDGAVITLPPEGPPTLDAALAIRDVALTLPDGEMLDLFLPDLRPKLTDDGLGLAFTGAAAHWPAGDLTATQAKTVLAVLVADGGDPAAIAASMGFEAMDTSELEAVVDRLIADHPEDWAALTTGDEKERRKKSGFFVGEVMKATRGQADGRAVNEMLARRAAEQGG